MFEELLGYLASGGFVMLPLLVLAGVLWYMLGYRFCNLWLTSWDEPMFAGMARQTNSLGCQYVMESALIEVEQCFARGRTLIQTICIVAPLAGLLGTVSGMIETFDSLADMSLFSQSGGIAGGISEALFTTQMGLIVAVPGVLLGRMLDRRAERRLQQIEEQALNLFRTQFQGELA